MPDPPPSEPPGAAESARLEALRRLGILSTEPEAAFDDIAEAAQAACGAPMAFISLVDADKVCFKAACGAERGEAERSWSFCAQLVEGEQVLAVPDAPRDARFAAHPSVSGPMGLKAYLGAPILFDGKVMGGVCVVDQRPREWTDDQAQAVARLARLASHLFEMRARQRDAADQAALRLRISQAGEQRMRDLMRAMPVAVYTVNAAGFVTFFNAAAAELWGHEPVIGETKWNGAVKIFTAEGEALRHDECAMARCLRERRSIRGVEIMAERPDGERVFFQTFPTPLFDPDGKLVGGVNILVDITGHKGVEARQAMLIDELVSARGADDGAQDAEAGSWAKSSFMANMSYELRSRLNGVVGVVEAIAQTPLDPRQLEMVGLISESARSVSRALSDIFDLSKIEAEKLSLAETTIDVAALVAGACDAMRPRAADKGLKFELDIDPAAAGAFLGDAARIRQVVFNLVSNAVNFTEAGEVGVRLGPDARSGGVSILVSDTGAGMDAAAVARLFDRSAQSGAGLSLSVTRGLVRMMGGDLSVNSRPGSGSRFSVRLPLERILVENREPKEPDGGRPVLEGLRVLVAEDHPVNRRVVQVMLEPFGIALSFAENGRTAVEACETGRFDAILMDMQMPVMDGLAATREIRAREAATGAPRLAIAMLSANVGAEHEAASMAAGADGHIPKPATLEGLMAGLAQAMARAKAAGAAGAAERRKA